MLEYHKNITGQISLQIHKEISAVTLTVTQLLSHLESMSEDSPIDRRQSRGDILKQMCERKNHLSSQTEEITAGVEMLSISDAAEQQLRVSVQNATVQRLGYPEMTNRYEDIDEAHPQTFEWAVTAPEAEQSWSNLADWLKAGSDIHWVGGKAGSGKLTFMKHLVDDQQNRLGDYLRVWAGGSDPVKAKKFIIYTPSSMETQ